MRFRWILLLLVVAALALRGTLSYYVDALWFDSLGYSEVFWRALSLQGTVFSTFFAATFLLLYGAFVALKPRRLGDFGSDNIILIGGHPVRLPVGRVLRTIVYGSLVIAAVAGAARAVTDHLRARWYRSGWTAARRIRSRSAARVLFLHCRRGRRSSMAAGLGVIVLAMSLFFWRWAGLRAIAGRLVVRPAAQGLRGVAFAWAFLLLILAGRKRGGTLRAPVQRAYDSSGVTYTDAHVPIGSSPRPSSIAPPRAPRSRSFA